MKDLNYLNISKAIKFLLLVIKISLKAQIILKLFLMYRIKIVFFLFMSSPRLLGAPGSFKLLFSMFNDLWVHSILNLKRLIGYNYFSEMWIYIALLKAIGAASVSQGMCSYARSHRRYNLPHHDGSPSHLRFE